MEPEFFSSSVSVDINSPHLIHALLYLLSCYTSLFSLFAHVQWLTRGRCLASGSHITQPVTVSGCVRRHQ